MITQSALSGASLVRPPEKTSSKDMSAEPNPLQTSPERFWPFPKTASKKGMAYTAKRNYSNSDIWQ
jgi:hypothetical protein